METPTREADNGDAVAAQATIIALFEDRIDAEQALVALRKANQTAERVSLIVRNLRDEQQADGAADVARDIVAVALGAVAQWLMGLAELVVSDRGRYLVAGPMGAALTGLGEEAGRDVGPGETLDPDERLTPGSMERVLTRFGFSPTQATYIEHRLSAGATLIAATLPDRTDYDRIHGLFREHDAVYIDVANTNPKLVQVTVDLLAAGPGLTGIDNLVVADVAAPLRPARPDDTSGLADLRGYRVVSDDDHEAGEVDQVLVEQAGPAGGVIPRYVVIGTGGLLGIGRRRTAVPVQLVDLSGEPALLRFSKSAMERAPEYDVGIPLGRREEERIFRYFGVAPYWRVPANPAPATTHGTEAEGV